MCLHGASKERGNRTWKLLPMVRLKVGPSVISVWFSGIIALYRLGKYQNHVLLGIAVYWKSRGVAQNVVYGSAYAWIHRENNRQRYLLGVMIITKSGSMGSWLTKDHGNGASGDYQEFFPVTLKKGKNVLLVSVSTIGMVVCMGRPFRFRTRCRIHSVRPWDQLLFVHSIDTNSEG